MKNRVKSTFIATFTLIVGYNTTVVQKQNSLSLELSLNTVGALVGCEVSPDHSENADYCSKQFDGNGRSCVGTGSGSEPCCSGNN